MTKAQEPRNDKSPSPQLVIVIWGFLGIWSLGLGHFSAPVGRVGSPSRPWRAGTARPTIPSQIFIIPTQVGDVPERVGKEKTRLGTLQPRLASLQPRIKPFQPRRKPLNTAFFAFYPGFYPKYESAIHAGTSVKPLRGWIFFVILSPGFTRGYCCSSLRYDCCPHHFMALL